MDTKTQTLYEARARIVKAMAHASRLLIVEELSRNGEKCVCELTEMISANISTVSRHLAVLIEATVEKITDITKITSFGVMMTPALAIDGEVKLVGKVASPEDIAKLLS